MAQLCEETGRLNDSIAWHGRIKKMLEQKAIIPLDWFHYYIGLTGVYMRRMELVQAQRAVDRSRAILEKEQIHADLTDMTLAYHEAEMKFLRGDTRGAPLV